MDSLKLDSDQPTRLSSLRCAYPWASAPFLDCLCALPGVRPSGRMHAPQEVLGRLQVHVLRAHAPSTHVHGSARRLRSCTALLYLDASDNAVAQADRSALQWVCKHRRTCARHKPNFVLILWVHAICLSVWVYSVGQGGFQEHGERSWPSTPLATSLRRISRAPSRAIGGDSRTHLHNKCSQTFCCNLTCFWLSRLHRFSAGLHPASCPSQAGDHSALLALLVRACGHYLFKQAAWRSWGVERG